MLVRLGRAKAGWASGTGPALWLALTSRTGFTAGPGRPSARCAAAAWSAWTSWLSSLISRPRKKFSAVRIAAIAASCASSVKLGDTAVRRMSAASWNSSPRARKRPRSRRTGANGAIPSRRSDTRKNRPKAITAPAKMTTAPAASTTCTATSTTSSRSCSPKPEAMIIGSFLSGWVVDTSYRRIRRFRCDDGPQPAAGRVWCDHPPVRRGVLEAEEAAGHVAREGSSLVSRRSAASTTVTSKPSTRCHAGAISSSAAPPPSTASRPGTSLAEVASRMSQVWLSRSPLMGGMTGVEPAPRIYRPGRRPSANHDHVTLVCHCRFPCRSIGRHRSASTLTGSRRRVSPGDLSGTFR